MYVQEITIKVESGVDKDLIIDEFSWLLAQYHRSGQVLSGSHTQFINGKQIVALPYSLERASLSKEHNNSFVNNQIKRLENLCQSELQIRTIGTDYETPTEVCSCEINSGYTLSAVAFSRDSPLSCKDCGFSIPLYRIPKMEDDSYTNILNWQLNSMICDGIETINLDNDDFEELTTAMLQTIIRRGENLCARIEKTTGIPTSLKKIPAEKKTLNKKGPKKDKV